ncbi:MAG: dinitrogenase iron-molybdenum cofactor biosynthesis protein [Thermoanaerobacterales bacterium]|nr:dinitrogenase iron-molybdenum cofactor biosynthesis protein [Thermoanaerobacterales bacterium]
MKVAITSTGKDLESMMDERFGRCSYFIITDTDSDEFQVFENRYVGGAHGVGVQVSQFIADKGVDAVITGNVGPNAMSVLGGAGIQVFMARSMTVKQALQSLSEGKLGEINAPTKGKHNL